MPAGQALFQMCGVFAEFERSMIQDRVKASINRVRAKGEPWGRRKIEEMDPAVCTQNLELRREGLGMVTIGKRVGLSSRTVWRFLRAGATPQLRLSDTQVQAEETPGDLRAASARTP